MKRIVSISLGPNQREYQFTTTVLGQRVAIRRVSAGGDMRRAAELVREHDGHVDAIGLDGITPIFRVGAARYPHREAIRVASAAHRTRLVDGGVIKSTLERRAAEQLHGIFSDRRILVLSGIDRYPLAQALTLHNADLRFADPLTQIGPLLPAPRSLKQLERYAAVALPFLALLPYRYLNPTDPGQAARSRRAWRLIRWAEIIVGDFAAICRFAPPDLSGKTIVTDDPSPQEIEGLRQRGAWTLITMTPPFQGVDHAASPRPFFAADVLEALAVAVMECGAPPSEAELLEFIDAACWQPTVQHLAGRLEHRGYTG